MSATAAIYILGETHKLNTYSTISHLGDQLHYMWYSKDLHEAKYIVLKMFIVIENKSYNLLFRTSLNDWKV